MTGHERMRSRQQVAFVAGLIAVLLTACSSTAGPSPAVRTGEPPTERIPIIIDTDLELSDLAAIAVLLRDPAVDVRAITISGTGLVDCATGRRVMRYVLDELGAFDIPFGCGREDGGPDAHPFPDAWRARAKAAFGLDIQGQPGSDTPRDAVSVLREAVDDSPSSPTIVALGPLTNLEDALAADETLADRLAGVQAMLGTVDAPGNVFADGLDAEDPLEWNAYADPSAVTAVFTSDVPLSLIPLDATRDVPVPADLADRLESDHQAAGADLVYELLVRNPERLRPEDGQQLWDELAALALTDPDLVSWEDASVTAGADGRFVRDDAGRTLRYAASADRPAVEAALLDALHRGEPRTTAFSLGGSIAVTFDGGRCAVTGTSDRPGVHELTYTGPSGQPSGVIVVGIRPPHRWEDVVALLPTYDARSAAPDWIVQGPSATDVDGIGTPVTATGPLDEDLAGVVCFTGEWPMPAFHPGTSFAVGGGAIHGDAIRGDALAPA
jgi:inosine-uridine nucleoside N-ribohydrolase